MSVPDRDFLVTKTDLSSRLPARYYPHTTAEEIAAQIRLDRQTQAMEAAKKIDAHRKHNAHLLATADAAAREYAASPYTTQPPYYYSDPGSYYDNVGDDYSAKLAAIMASIDATTRRNQLIAAAVEAIRAEVSAKARAEIEAHYNGQTLYVRRGPRFVRL